MMHSHDMHAMRTMCSLTEGIGQRREVIRELRPCDEGIMYQSDDALLDSAGLF